MENSTWLIISLIYSGCVIFSPYLLKKKISLSSLTNLVITLGILGTFCGIVIGLWGFNVDNIQDSVPILLEGLRFAFLTSIAGLFSSVILKLSPQIYGIAQTKEEQKKKEAPVERMIELLENIQQGISGEGETTLLTQIQKLRTNTDDRLEELNKSFQEFAEQMVEDNTQSLIEALTQVMEDFNTKINEQFGENFKELNEAVGKMLKWQKEYAERIKVMTEQFESTKEAIVDTEQVLTNLVKKAEKYSDISEEIDYTIADLNKKLEAFEEMAESAKEAFPIIEERLDQMTKEFSASVESAVRENNRTITTIQDTINEQINTLERSYQELGNKQNELQAEFNAKIDKMMKDNADRITEQLQNLDEQLADELNKSLTTLSNQLTSLSAKFVEDYEPLTEKLREVVEIANNNR